MRKCRVRVKKGYRALREAVSDFLAHIYRYNSLIGETGYYLKPTHIVTKKLDDGTRLRYIYIGRYWWRLSYGEGGGGRRSLRWRYVGKEKPAELEGYPDPPSSPLQGLRVVVDGDDVILDCKAYQRYKWLFEGYEAVTV